MVRVRYGAAVCGAVLAALVVTGCTAADGESPSPPPASTPAPTASETSPTPGEAALTAYKGMWDVVIKASHNSDPDPGELDRYATGNALALMRQTLRSANADDVTVVGEPVLDPEITEVSPETDPDTVVVLDCVDDSQWTEESSATPSQSADPNEDEPRKVDATVHHDGFTWQVSKLRIWEQGTC